jgi:hypothetical protein
MESDLQKIKQVKRKYEKQWLAYKGVVAVGIGFTSENVHGIIISVEHLTDALKSKLPTEIEGIPLEIQVSGPIVAQ